MQAARVKSEKEIGQEKSISSNRVDPREEKRHSGPEGC